MGHIKTETAMGEKKRKPEAEIMMAYLARNYRRSLMRLDLCRMEGISESRLIYEADHSYVCLIERALADCSPSTRQIINEEFLHKKDKDWYLGYWSRTTVYRKRKEAIGEFLHCLHI